jgi:hypothetical protein
MDLGRLEFMEPFWESSVGWGKNTILLRCRLNRLAQILTTVISYRVDGLFKEAIEN